MVGHVRSFERFAAGGCDMQLGSAGEEPILSPFRNHGAIRIAVAAFMIRNAAIIWIVGAAETLLWPEVSILHIYVTCD